SLRSCVRVGPGRRQCASSDWARQAISARNSGAMGYHCNGGLVVSDPPVGRDWGRFSHWTSVRVRPSSGRLITEGHRTSARIVIDEVDKDACRPMMAMEKYIHGGQLGEEVLALVRTRASQLNGCAFCLDMHADEGRK